MDGDALCMPMDHWLAILKLAYQLCLRLRWLSCYAMACNILEKTDSDLCELYAAGLIQLYICP